MKLQWIRILFTLYLKKRFKKLKYSRVHRPYQNYLHRTIKSTSGSLNVIFPDLVIVHRDQDQHGHRETPKHRSHETSYFTVLLLLRSKNHCKTCYFTSPLLPLWARQYYKLLLYQNTCSLLCCCWSIEEHTGWFKRVIDLARPQNQVKVQQHSRRQTMIDADAGRPVTLLMYKYRYLPV